MKKLFTLALSAVALMSLSACGGGENYSKDVLAAPEGVNFHYVNTVYEWAAKDNNKLAATSVAEVAKFDKALAKTLAGKSLKYLYSVELTIAEADTEDAWKAKYVAGGELKEVNSKYAIKVIESAWNDEESTYSNTHWIPNPADTDCCHVEALNEGIFVPPYQKEKDDNGLSWADNPVMIAQPGKYHFVFAQYTNVSSESAAGYGFGLSAAK